MGRDTHTGGRPATNGVIVGDFALSVGKPEKECPSGWAWVSLSEVARLETGHTPSRKHPEYWDGNIPWIGIKDATANHGRIIYNTYQHITALGIENSSARLLPANTVCLSRTASVGYVVVMGRPMATSQDFVNWVCGQELDYLYLKYILMLEKSALLRFASGTTHQTVYFPEAKAFHVCLPPLPTQKAIAHILGILDDKIELLREMNQTLEAMTRALFKSWFIDFDPVRKKSEGEPSGLPPEIDRLFPDSFQDSELGEIPKGWSITCLGDVITIYDSRRIPLSSMEREKKQGNYPYYGATSIMDYVDEYLFDGIFVLLGEDGSVAKEDGTPFTQYVWGKFWVNNVGGHDNSLVGSW
jgi:type I restriction enzyme S subunit